MELFKLLGRIAVDNADANKSIDQTTDVAKKAQRGLDDLSGEGERSESRLGKAFSKVGSFAASAGKIIGTGMLAAGAALGGLAIKALNLGGELEQNLGGSEAVFKEYAGRMQEIGKSAFSNMGLSQSDFLSTANKMGALFQGAGFSIAESSDIASQAMQRAADVASIMGIDTSAAMEAVAGAAKGNFTMMDNLGVAMNDTQIQAYAMSKGINKSTQEMTQQEKIGLAMEMFLEKTSYAAGNYAKENETLAGSLGTAKAALQNFLAGSGSTDDLVNSVMNVANVVTDRIAELLPRLTTGLTDLVVKLIPKIPPLLNTMLPALINGAVGLMNGLLAAIPSIITILLDSLPLLINGFVSLIVTLVQYLPEIILPIIERLPEIVMTIVRALMDNLPILITGLVELVVGIVAALPDIILTLIDYLPTIITSIVSALWNSLPILLGGLGQILSSIFSAIWDLLKPLVSWIGEFFGGLWESIKAIFQPVIDWFKGIFDSVVAVFHTVVDPWIEIFKIMFENIKTFLSGIWTDITAVFSAAWDAIKIAFAPVTDFFSGIWNGIKGAFSAVSTWFKDTFSGAWNAVKDVFSTGGKIFDGIKDGISNVFKTVVNGLIGGINKVISVPFNAINAMLGKIKGINILGVSPFDWIETFNVPQIPQLAKGTVVTRPRVVEVGEDGAEAIVPLERNTGWIDRVAERLNEFSGVSSNTLVERSEKVTIQLNIENFINNRKQDIEQLTDEISEIMEARRISREKVFG